MPPPARAVAGAASAASFCLGPQGSRLQPLLQGRKPGRRAQAAVIDVFTQSRPLALAPYRAPSATSRAASMLSTEPGVTVGTPPPAALRQLALGGPSCVTDRGGAGISVTA